MSELIVVVEVLEADRNQDLLLLAGVEADAREALQLLVGPTRFGSRVGRPDDDDFVARHAAGVLDSDVYGQDATFAQIAASELQVIVLEGRVTQAISERKERADVVVVEARIADVIVEAGGAIGGFQLLIVADLVSKVCLSGLTRLVKIPAKDNGKPEPEGRG